MKTIVSIINANHTLSSLNQRIIHACKQHIQFKINTFFTSHPKHAVEIAQQQTNENADIIVAVGGDGTIHEILNGILSVHSYKPILAILPNGQVMILCALDNISKLQRNSFILFNQINVNQ